MRNAGGAARLLLLGDHAGRAIPRALGSLGLNAGDLDRHIAWDIGVDALGRTLSAALDAVFIAQRYSRLVIDCNRALGDPASIAESSDATPIPGNAGLTAGQRAARTSEIFSPYHQAIADELDRRQTAGRPTLLVALHSFTPVMAGDARPWRYGVLHRHDSAFSAAVLAALRARHGDIVGDNQPYAMDGTDFTIPHHADARGLDYLELEVRQDLLTTAAGVAEVAAEVGAVLADPHLQGEGR